VLAAKGDRTVFFDADEEAEFGKAVATMDLARAGGASTIAVLTAPLPK
jgi:biopolymer transport protein ExbD/biopolymer transport protein TolR